MTLSNMNTHKHATQDISASDLAHTMGTGEILLDDRGTAPSEVMTDEQLHNLARGIIEYIQEGNS